MAESKEDNIPARNLSEYTIRPKWSSALAIGGVLSTAFAILLSWVTFYADRVRPSDLTPGYTVRLLCEASFPVVLTAIDVVIRRRGSWRLTLEQLEIYHGSRRIRVLPWPEIRGIAVMAASLRAVPLDGRVERLYWPHVQDGRVLRQFWAIERQRRETKPEGEGRR